MKILTVIFMGITLAVAATANQCTAIEANLKADNSNREQIIGELQFLDKNINLNAPQHYYTFGFLEDLENNKTELRNIITNYDPSNFVQTCEEIYAKMDKLLSDSAVFVPGVAGNLAICKEEFTSKFYIVFNQMRVEERKLFNYEMVWNKIQDTKSFEKYIDVYVDQVNQTLLDFYQKFRETILPLRNPSSNDWKSFCQSKDSIVRKIVTKCEELFMPNLPDPAPWVYVDDEDDLNASKMEDPKDPRRELIRFFRSMIEGVKLTERQLIQNCDSEIETIRSAVFQQMKKLRDWSVDSTFYYQIWSEIDDGNGLRKSVANLNKAFEDRFEREIKKLEQNQLVDGDSARLPFTIIPKDNTLTTLIEKVKELKLALLHHASAWSKGKLEAYEYILNSILKLLLEQINYIKGTRLANQAKQEPQDVCKVFSTEVTSFDNWRKSISKVVREHIDKALLWSQKQIVDELEKLRTDSLYPSYQWSSDRSNNPKQYGQILMKRFSDEIFRLVIVKDNAKIGLRTDKLRRALLAACLDFHDNQLPITINQMIDDLSKKQIFVPAEINDFSVPFKEEVFRANFEMLRPCYLAENKRRAMIALGAMREHVKGFQNKDVLANSQVHFSWQQMVNDLERIMEENIKKLEINELNLNDFNGFKRGMADQQDIYVGLKEIKITAERDVNKILIEMVDATRIVSPDADEYNADEYNANYLSNEISPLVEEKMSPFVGNVKRFLIYQMNISTSPDQHDVAKAAAGETGEKNLLAYTNQTRDQLLAIAKDIFRAFTSEEAERRIKIDWNRFQSDLKGALVKFFKFLDGLDLNSFIVDLKRIRELSAKTGSGGVLISIVPVAGPFLVDPKWSRIMFDSKYAEKSVELIQKQVKKVVESAIALTGGATHTRAKGFEDIATKFDAQCKEKETAFSANIIGAAGAADHDRTKEIFRDYFNELNAAAKVATSLVIQKLEQVFV